ncbi:YfgM family protein [Paraburkholderia silvatlantica]|uniref:Ancillary SecYEG translocon subunit n=1 Tax=Paraburkholderia silvatlantica TaxID=321895 RepID=A0A2U1AHC8_9BURK|nr:tetratricopeptide repeat protein [Paraburkholderia silvatlantica]MBB2929519.1 putative negative regulator of RcsB-dependent stress response [Paraburkholderia silvatlantica]PVY35791.1 putative negative regulator of RcsB-dependent stress response [Paraburkholderia silvatlantica]PXW39739.1 putative negative regulator of RcsB-dependent stress response [Paraburkholderia silvatlantica]PYE21952.1 putative negative regulator of RcsB-dependent stress response [Paraburkholderia silvatlantica]TDQ99361
MSYHDEQESIESFKAWWAQWGNATTWVVLIVLLALAAWNGWNFWQRRQAAEAAVLYDQVQQAANGSDKAMLTRVASDMEDRFGGTAYAQMTALGVAKALYMAGDTAGAKAQLQWAADHAKDDEFRQIAKLRLASLLLDEKAYDQGLALIPQPDSGPFKGIVADGRGDLLAAAGKRDDARAAYKLALDSLPKSDASERQLIQFKLDALGG